MQCEMTTYNEAQEAYYEALSQGWPLDVASAASHAYMHGGV